MSVSIDSSMTRAQWAALGGCLLDFEAFPGRYALALREPRLLFDHGTAVLMLACGRAAEGLPQDEALEAQLRQAARFFVRTAMLRAGVDHYTLLGLTPAFEPSTLREHYRMLMRLTHPDFSEGGGAWPSDAATRINQANDVLSSAVGRRDYDRNLGTAGPSWRPVMRPPLERPHRRSWVAHGDREASPVRRRMMVGGLTVGALAMGLWWSITPGPHEPAETLRVVQRPPALAESPAPRPAPINGERAAPSLPPPAPTPTVPIAPAPPVAVAPAMAQANAATVWVPPKPAVNTRLAASDAVALRAASGGVFPAVRAVAGPETSRAAAVPHAAAAPMPSPGPLAAIAAGGAAFGASPVTVPSAVLVPSMPAPAQAVPALATTAAPAVALATPGSAPAPSAPGSPPAPSARPRLSMDDVQPLLGNVLAAMQSGRGEQVLRWVERPSRPGDGADGFVQTFNRVVGDARAVRVGAVRFSGRPGDDGLVVDGVVLLQLNDENQNQVKQELVLRAQFASRGGQAVLTRLSASEPTR